MLNKTLIVVLRGECHLFNVNVFRQTGSTATISSNLQGRYAASHLPDRLRHHGPLGVCLYVHGILALLSTASLLEPYGYGSSDMLWLWRNDGQCFLCHLFECLGQQHGPGRHRFGDPDSPIFPQRDINQGQDGFARTSSGGRNVSNLVCVTRRKS